MWKQRAARALEVASRSRTTRLAARRLAVRGVLPSNALPFLHIEPRFFVKVPGHGQFRYSATDADAVGRHLFWRGLADWEEEAWREFIPLARRARGFLDIGAFTGCYSLVAAVVNPTIKCVAFEPVAGVYDQLVRNVATNDLQSRILTIPAAVSGEVGTQRFFIPDRAMPDTGFLESSNRQSQEAGSWHVVQTTTVAASLPQGFQVDLVKIDVEDAEGPVVEAMLDVLAEHRPTIFVEFLATGSYARATDALAALGYRFFHLTPAGRVAVDRPAPLPDATYFNYLCVPSAR